MKSIGGNSVMVRQINREVIRHALMATERASIAELARVTGLSVATCSNIMPELVASGEALELRERRSRGGRPARTYACNPDHALIAAVLLGYGAGKPFITHSVRNTAGAPLAEGEEKLASLDAADIDRLLDRLVREHPAIKVIAVSVPGIIHAGTIEQCDIASLSGVRLEERLRGRYGVEALVENDMNLAAAGYYRARAGSAPSGLAFLIIPRDKCAGGGLIVNGALVRGMSNFAGEVSYIPLGQEKLTPGSAGRRLTVRYAARLATSVIAVVNPDVVVLSGEAMREDMHQAVRDGCLEAIPEQHMPELVIRPDYTGDCFDGMVAMALNCLSLDVRLVERGRNWCGE